MEASSSSNKVPNRLVNETSPYLLQHAYNPVDWYPWGEEAFEKARQENKPVLVSIGYAACHWCHVMERESFEDEATAALMNEHLVNIKIDREERPDLDHIYMDALQAINGSGGWPLNVFLTPDARPFYGGTYFPTQPAHNLPSWKHVVLSISRTFKEKKEEVEDQASKLTEHLRSSNSFGIKKQGDEALYQFTKDAVELAAQNLLKTADTQEGGFGRAPKFPQTFSIRFLLHHYHYTGNEEALKQACLSLDKMIYGGLYDQLQGGFARYATDNKWLVPHFEKMLYDNALLVGVMSEAFQMTGKELYKKTVLQTIDFIAAEWTQAKGGFYASYDADSEGEEGKYYVWTYEEVTQILGPDAPLFCKYYDVSPEGNWEGHSILNRPRSDEEFLRESGLSPASFNDWLNYCSKALLEERSGRIKPLLDDKVLLGWNALMVTGLCKAYAAFGEDRHLKMAEDNMEFLWNTFWKDGKLWHTFKNDQLRYPAFLDDLAWWIEALIALQEQTGKLDYLQKARWLTEHVVKHFGEEDGIYFYYTADGQKDVIVRKKEVYDGATPSGNAVMAANLYALGIVFDETNWVKRARAMVDGLHQPTVKYPGSFGCWALLLQGLTYGIPEIVLMGKDLLETRKDFLRNFIPLKIFQSATQTSEGFPMLTGKSESTQPLFYVCKEFVCHEPVGDIAAVRMLL